jgi:catechol 2,3-dioxygenase-like lactoylglutathione lyase family enzyme
MAELKTPAALRLTSIHPVFLVPDVVLAAEWYRDKLGFHFDRYWGEPPCFCIVHRDGVSIFLKGPEEGCALEVRPNRSRAEAWDAYIDVSNADALAGELRSRGVAMVAQPEDTVYCMRELEVVDLNGYALCFGQDISGNQRQ